MASVNADLTVPVDRQGRSSLVEQNAPVKIEDPEVSKDFDCAVLEKV